MSIQSNLQDVRMHIPDGVSLVCVSKFHPAESIQEAYNCGERIFGESKVQELCSKYERLPSDIQWHFIGHLQTNKVKNIVPFVSLIHGIDSYRLLEEVNKQAAKVDRVVNCLLQMHIAQEETKFGFSAHELVEMLKADEWKNLTNIRICGLMGMATFTDNQKQVSNEFKSLTEQFRRVKREFFPNDAYFSEISMGMSDDYRLAIEAGSTMVRIGSTIFGHRNY